MSHQHAWYKAYTKTMVEFASCSGCHAVASSRDATREILARQIGAERVEREFAEYLATLSDYVAPRHPRDEVRA